MPTETDFGNSFMPQWMIVNLALKNSLAYLSEDGIAIVGEHNTPHRVEEHFEHGLWSEGGPHDVGHGFGGLDVGALGLLALLSLGVLV